LGEIIHPVALLLERMRSSQQHKYAKTRPADARDKRRARVRKWIIFPA
jgi:hypothetical protein